MKNEDAIKILVGNKNFYERIIRPYDREMVEALNIAIKVLETIDKIKFNVYALNELLQEAENEQTTD